MRNRLVQIQRETCHDQIRSQLDGLIRDTFFWLAELKEVIGIARFALKMCPRSCKFTLQNSQFRGGWPSCDNALKDALQSSVGGWIVLQRIAS